MLNVKSLERSLAQIKDRPREFAANFYHALFIQCPATQPLFQSVDRQAQGEELCTALALVVANLHQPDDLTAPLRALGTRYAEYGVTTEQMEQALLHAFAVTLDTDWTPNLQQRWQAAYHVVADAMGQEVTRPTFQLMLSQVLQGEFRVKGLNLLLVFQVNCPGCFIYALPLATRLQDRYGDRVNILGLSTVFEDFHLNTAENTRRLLKHGELVGMTQRYWQQYGESEYEIPIRFPVAFDRVENCPVPSPSSAKLAAPIYPDVGQTFRVNQLQGTPSWILFDQSLTILAQWFGHKSESDVEAILHRWLTANSVHHANEQSV
jgi:hemoglobin-like flavoprotein